MICLQNRHTVCSGKTFGEGLSRSAVPGRSTEKHFLNDNVVAIGFKLSRRWSSADTDFSRVQNGLGVTIRIDV